MYFLACFSKNYLNKEKTFMNSELNIAIEHMQEMPQNRVWFIPVKLSNCEVPDLYIGGAKTLKDIQWVDLYSNSSVNVNKIIKTICNRSDPRRT